MRRFIMLSAMLLSLMLAACGQSDIATDSSGSGAISQPPVQLKLNVQPGAEFVAEVTTTSEIKTELGAGSAPIAMNSTSTTKLTQKIDSVDADGNVTVKLTYDTVSISPTLNTGDSEFNGMANQIIGGAGPEGIQQILGKDATFTMVLAPNGAIKAMPEIEAMLKQSLNSMDRMDVQEQQELFDDLHESMLDSVKDGYNFAQNGGFLLPEKPINVGDSWTEHQALNVIFAVLDIETTYTVTERQDGVITISFNGEGQVNPSQEPNPLLNNSVMQLDVDLAITQGGTLQIDEKTGWMLASVVDQTITGSMGYSATSVDGKLGEVSDMLSDSTPTPGPTATPETFTLPLNQHAHTEIKTIK